MSRTDQTARLSERGLKTMYKPRTGKEEKQLLLYADPLMFVFSMADKVVVTQKFLTFENKCKR